MNVNAFIKIHYNNMVKAGFYPCPNFIHKKGDYQGYCSICGGSNINPNKNIGELLALIVGELCGEALEAHRNNRFSTPNLSKLSKNTYIKTLKDLYNEKTIFAKNWFNNRIKGTFEDEITDTDLRIFDLCGYLKIDIRPIKVHLDPFKVVKGKNVAEDFYNISRQLPSVPQDFDKEKERFSYQINVVYCLLKTFCKIHQIPIERHVRLKMAYNTTRPYKHGKEY